MTDLACVVVHEHIGMNITFDLSTAFADCMLTVNDDDDDDDNVGFAPTLLPPVQFYHQNKMLQKDITDHDDDAFSLQLLLDAFGERWQFAWIKQRIKLLWPEIQLAGRHVTNASCTQQMRHRLRVFDRLLLAHSVLLILIVL